MSRQKTLEDVVFENGLTDILRLERAKRESTMRNVSLAATLIDLGYVEQRALAATLALATGLPLVDPLPVEEATKLRNRLPAALARENMAVPIAMENDKLTVAMLDPTSAEAVSALESASGLAITPAVAIRSPLESLVDHLYPEYQGEDITLMSAARLSLDLGDNSPGAAGSRAEDQTETEPADDFGTVVAVAAEDGEDTTKPRRSATIRPVEVRVEMLESRLVDVTRILADVQARLDAIEARLRRLPTS